MEFPQPFNSDQSSYLDRVLRELELRCNDLLNKHTSLLSQHTELLNNYNTLRNAPAFSAILTPVTTLPAGVLTKINYQVELFDTNNCYDTTLSRFTPNVAGYYFIHAVSQAANIAAGTFLQILKNGASEILGFYYQNTSSLQIVTVDGLVFCNGTTDYIEIGQTSSVASSTAIGSTNLLKFQGFLARLP